MEKWREKDAECPDDTTPVDTEEGVSDRKDDNNEKMMGKKRQNPRRHLPCWGGGRCKRYKWRQESNNDEEVESECLDDTSPVDVEEGVNDIKYEKNKKNDEDK